MLEVVSIHIGKTAGTSFRHILLQVFGRENVFLDYSPYTYEPPDPLPANIRAIHGHIAVEKYLNRFESANWIVWLRHPVFRLISEYFFAQIYKDIHNPLHVALMESKLGLLEFAEQFDARNIQSQQVRGKQLSEFYFVGVQEFYEEDLLELRQRSGWSEINISTENVNPHPAYAQDLQGILSEPSIIKQLALWNQDDMELYQEALSLRATRRQESLFFQYTIAGLKQSQPLIRQMQAKLSQLEMQIERAEQQPLALKVLRAEGQQNAEKLLDFSVDLPATAEAIISDSIRIEGWAIGKQEKAVALRVLFRERVLIEVPINQQRPDVAEVYPVLGAESSGFSTTVFVTGVQEGSELSLQVLLADQSKVEISVIHFMQAE